MSAQAILSEVISILTGGLTSTASALGGGIKDMIQQVFLTTTGTGSDATTSLSIVAIVVLVFGGVTLAFGLFRWALNLITSFGNRNR